MAVFKVAVLLTAYANGELLSLERDAQFYERYFFNPEYGQSAYWTKQTDNEVVLEGIVDDWKLFPDGSLDVTDRTSVALTVVQATQRAGNIDLTKYGLAIIVLGLNDHVVSDGGSTAVHIDDKRLRVVVVRIGDRFDFVEHEIGHGIGLDHSFGSIVFSIVGERPGGYGHPHCVMSAMAYGGIPGGGAFSPVPPREGLPDFSGLGPSLNAVAALQRGWLKAEQFYAGEGVAQDFVLRSRHFGGRNFLPTPQAIEIILPDKRNFALEFRRPVEWDRAQDGPMLILTQDRGGVADEAYPGKAAGTYISRFKIPVTLGGMGHVRNFSGFGIQVLDYTPTQNTATVRLFPGQAPLVHLNTSSRVELLERNILATGSTTWARGEKRCVEGTHRYEKVGQKQRATFEITCDAAPGHAATWTVEGRVLRQSDRRISISKDVEVANPKLLSSPANRTVHLDVEIKRLANGSRLTVTSAPPNERFNINVSVELNSRIGSRVETFDEELAGTVYDYGSEFELRRLTCLVDLSDIGKRFATYEVFPDFWGKIPLFKRPEFETFRWVLAYLKDQDEKLFQAALAELPLITLTPDITIDVAKRTTLEVETPEFIDERPAPVIQI